jgi:hypothetical protein
LLQEKSSLHNCELFLSSQIEERKYVRNAYLNDYVVNTKSPPFPVYYKLNVFVYSLNSFNERRVKLQESGGGRIFFVIHDPLTNEQTTRDPPWKFFKVVNKNIIKTQKVLR